MQLIRYTVVGIDQSAFALPPYTNVQIVQQTGFKALANRHLHAGRAGLQEAGVQRIRIGNLRGRDPILFVAPKIRVKNVGHIPPFKGIFKKLNIAAFRLGIRKGDFGIAVRRYIPPHGIKSVKVLRRQ